MIIVDRSLPDLLADQLRSTSIVLPLAQEQLAQERVKRFLLVAILFTSAGVLLLQGRKEPLQHQHGSLGSIGLFCWRREYGGVLGPV